MTEPLAPNCPTCHAPAVRAVERPLLAILTQEPTGVRVGDYACAQGHVWQTKWPVAA